MKMKGLTDFKAPRKFISEIRKMYRRSGMTAFSVEIEVRLLISLVETNLASEEEVAVEILLMAGKLAEEDFQKAFVSAVASGGNVCDCIIGLGYITKRGMIRMEKLARGSFDLRRDWVQDLLSGLEAQRELLQA